MVDFAEPVWQGRLQPVGALFRHIADASKRRSRWVAVTIASCVAIGALACAAPAPATTTTFGFTGAQQTFVVPGGVTSIHVVVVGGRGGASEFAGGLAAQVTAGLTVTPGQTLYIEVGGKGAAGSAGGAGGFNGGGAAGGPGAGGGGGASDIRTSPREAGLSPDTRLIVAAGGGGGGRTGATGSGAEGGAAGQAGGDPEGISEGGGAGTETEGGAGGGGCFESGDPGQLALGGDGGGGEISEAGPGGGGGGGYFGGGGGGGACSAGGGGGGGGSSLVPLGGSLVLASSESAPKIEVSYTLVPPSISIVSPIDGATFTKGQVVAANYSCAAPIGASVTSCSGPVANGTALDTGALGHHVFKVEAKDSDGATAGKSIGYEVVARPPFNTLLGSHPRKTIKTTRKKVKVKFTFSSSEPGATFKCKLDKKAFAPCTSPKTYKVKQGKHTFTVEAISEGGVDPTPATFPFKVKRIK
jgi:hypothetical protein